MGQFRVGHSSIQNSVTDLNTTIMISVLGIELDWAAVIVAFGSLFRFLTSANRPRTKPDKAD
jgi:hypothetical protein